MMAALGRPRALLLASAALVSCVGSKAPQAMARNSNFSTFSSVDGTVSTRWPDGTTDSSAVELDKEEGVVGADTCEVSLHGDVLGRVGHPDMFSVQPSGIIVECDRAGAERWHWIGTTDNLTLSKAGDTLAIRDTRAGGPKSACSDTAMPVDVSVSVTDAIGTVEPSSIDVAPDFLRRVRIAGKVGETTCGVAEMSIDIVAEIRPDAFKFTEYLVSASE